MSRYFLPQILQLDKNPQNATNGHKDSGNFYEIL